VKVVDRRSEPRLIAKRYMSVEFSVSDSEPPYLFKIENFSFSGMGILVKEGSGVLENIKVGDVLDMKYYPQESPAQPEYLKTEIRHITRYDPLKYKGIYLVGLSVLDKQISDKR